MKADASELAIGALEDLEAEAIDVMKQYRGRVAAARQDVVDLRLRELQRLAAAACGAAKPPPTP